MARIRTSKVNKARKARALLRSSKRSKNSLLTYKEAGVTSTSTSSPRPGRNEADRLLTTTRTYFKKGGKYIHPLN